MSTDILFGCKAAIHATSDVVACPYLSAQGLLPVRAWALNTRSMKRDGEPQVVSEIIILSGKRPFLPA